MTSPPTPQAVAAILATERARITSVIDRRISEWEQFQSDYPDHPGLDILLAELDDIKGVVNASEERQAEADHPGD